MFVFIVKRFYFLRHIPFAPLVFDAMLKISTWLFNSKVLQLLDEIENEVLSWPDITLKPHRYGGTEFLSGGKEIGHLHSNGLLDILFSSKIKARLLEKGLVSDHHKFPRSGWISFFIRNENDKLKALGLLKESYIMKTKWH